MFAFIYHRRMYPSRDCKEVFTGPLRNIELSEHSLTVAARIQTACQCSIPCPTTNLILTILPGITQSNIKAQ